MICKNCGKEFEGSFCPECGMQAGLQYASCPKCGKERGEMEKFCSGCGYNFLNGNAVVQGKKSFKEVFSKIYNYLIAGGTILLGVIAMLCLLSPVGVVDGLLGKEPSSNGFEAIKGGELMEFDKIVSQLCIGILVVSIICIIYGVAKFFLIKRQNNLQICILWGIDGCISVLYLILSSVLLAYISSESSELMKIQMGAGFVLHLVMGIVAFIMLWVRIGYEMAGQSNKMSKEKNSLPVEVVIPMGTERIGNKAYYNNKDLVLIDISDSVTSIDKKSFFNCCNLPEISIPKNVTTIGDYAFYCCKSLKQVVIPDKVNYIGDKAFAFCSSMTEVYIPLSVTKMGDMVFDGCGKVTIFCVADSKPEEWSSTWNICNYPVVWGYKGN